MLENNYDKESYKKMSLVLIFFTLCTYVYMLYVTFYSVLSRLFKNQTFTDLIIKVHGNRPNAFINMGLVMLFYLSAFMLFTPASVISAEKKKRMGQIGFTSLFLFVCTTAVQYFHPVGVVGMGLNMLFFGGFFIPLLEFRKNVEEDLRKDRRNVIESQFDQTKDKVETPYSVNIPFKYFYNKAERMSWINIVNPFRAVLVGGVPGSGKSFATIEEIMRQFTKKGFTGVVYDFKFPTLSTKQYNYSTWYQQNYKIPPKFYVINFDDPEYSNRCNPINVDTLQTMADAEENTKVLMLNINKTWIEKEGDFFTDSANVFTSMLMWYLKILTVKYDYDICSFPHLVALTTFESTEILFLLLAEYNDLKPKMKPFAEALEKGALEQLAGQVSSAGVALSKITTVELNYILTGDDFSFDLNNPLAPKILCLGNNPDRQMTYSAPIGLIMTKLSKTLNRAKQLPSMFCVDEFPTVYIRGIENLIATGRSNKIATILGFQSFAQNIANYGKEMSDQLVRICGTRIMGQMMDEDAQLISANIGKHKTVQRSFSYGQEVSESKSTQLEDIVPAPHIAQFSQGTFCGVIADDFEKKDDSKAFVGELCPPLDLKKIEEKIPLPKIYDFTPPDLKERVDAVLQEYSEHYNQVTHLLLGTSIKDWIIRIEDTTTERNFYEFFITSNGLDYKSYREFFIKIDFKNGLTEYFKKLLNSNENLDRNFTPDELITLLDSIIEKGIRKQYKNDFLTEYNDDIYKDIYRIIALEVQDLHILDAFADDRSKRKKFQAFFSRIMNSDKLKDNIVKKEYQKIINSLE